MKPTISKLIESTYLPASLVRATIRQAGGWESFKESARDIANHGADCGFHGFIYYRDTVAFSKRNKAAILEACRSLADDMGESVYKTIGGFNCLKISEGEAAEAIHNPRSDQADIVLNALAWFALEETARAYTDMVDQ